MPDGYTSDAEAMGRLRQHHGLARARNPPTGITRVAGMFVSVFIRLQNRGSWNWHRAAYLQQRALWQLGLDLSSRLTFNSTLGLT